MTNILKVGDKVRVRSEGSNHNNRVGTIVRTDTSEIPYMVEFDNQDMYWAYPWEVEPQVAADRDVVKLMLKAAEAQVEFLKGLL